MKNRLLTGLLALALAAAMLPTAALADAEGVGPEDGVELVNPFPDVPDGADYAEAVIGLAEIGIIVGDGDGNFNPDATITRAEVATIICRLVGAEEDAAAMRRSVFDDVPASHWAVGYIGKAAELGIINGNGTGNFRPSAPVTYEQIVKMLVSAWGYEDWAQEEGGWPSGYLFVAEMLEIKVNVPNFTAAVPRSTVAQLVYQTILAPNGNAGDVEE